DDRLAYEISRLHEYDTENALYTKYEEGKEEGIEIGEEKANLRVARNMMKKGIDLQTIADLMDLPLEQIQSLA
ncbi:MAG: hypothetical protein SPJ02_02645, partial [Parabacteroides sp.]|nr:hypothetical protein [Parabacteroides sp.]